MKENLTRQTSFLQKNFSQKPASKVGKNPIKDLLIEVVVEGVAYDPHDFTLGGNQILVRTALEVCKSWLTAVKWKTWQEDQFMKLPNEKEIFKSFANNIVCSQIAKLFRAILIIKESISIREKPNHIVRKLLDFANLRFEKRLRTSFKWNILFHCVFSKQSFCKMIKIEEKGTLNERPKRKVFSLTILRCSSLVF